MLPYFYLVSVLTHFLFVSRAAWSLLPWSYSWPTSTFFDFKVFSIFRTSSHTLLLSPLLPLLLLSSLLLQTLLHSFDALLVPILFLLSSLLSIYSALNIFKTIFALSCTFYMSSVLKFPGLYSLLLLYSPYTTHSYPAYHFTILSITFVLNFTCFVFSLNWLHFILLSSLLFFCLGIFECRNMNTNLFLWHNMVALQSLTSSIFDLLCRTYSNYAAIFLLLYMRVCSILLKKNRPAIKRLNDITKFTTLFY